MPKVIGSSVVKTYPVSACVVPSLTNVKKPEVISVFSSKSVALLGVGVPEELTV